MDIRTVLISTFVLCIVTIRGQSNNLLSTVPTDLTKNYEKISTLPVPHSDHENPEKPSHSKFPRYMEPDFVPTKLYAQVRKTHTVKRLPREEAVKSATNEEEILAAPRLRKIVSKSKKNTFYTEEGYEDAAYDHGGHIRDADFYEDYTGKLNDEENIEVDDVRKEPNVEDEKTEISTNGTYGLKNYDDDDSSDDNSSIVEESERRKKIESGYAKKFESKNPWEESSINPKKTAENEIVRLEEDLKREYSESEKNTETDIPINLRNLDEEDADDDGEFINESDAAENQRYEKRKGEESFEPGEALPKLSNNFSSIESEKNEVDEISSSNLKEITDIPTSVNKSSDYGKIFWEYFKTVKNNEQTNQFSTPEKIEAATRNTKKFVTEGITIIPSAETTLADSDLNVNSQSTEFNDFLNASRIDYPSTSSSYDSWKRQDQYENTGVSGTKDFPSLAFPTSESDEMEALENDDDDDGDPSLNLENVGGSTTLISPKKVSYTVIIRPGEKSATENPPCDLQVHTRKREKAPDAKSSLRNSVRAGGIRTKLHNYSFADDFTATQAPVSTPLSQVTYSDFMPDSHASLAAHRPSVTREIGSNGEEIINNIERDRYKSMKNFYVNHGPKLRPRYPRLRRQKKKLHHFLPSSRLVPPSPINRSKYSDYIGVKRIGKPNEKLDANFNWSPWPDIMRFYRSFERRIYGRRRRSLDDNDNKKDNLSQIDREKMRRNKLWLERNFFREDNRLLANDNALPVKSITNSERKRRNDDGLLHKAPKIVDEIINGEIESRFMEKDVNDDKYQEKFDEKREKVEIEVPDFNFSEVADDKESQDVITKRPPKQLSLDMEKYPFYVNPEVPRNSALQYIMNPLNVPKKTFGGTEFYDSRNEYRECEEVEPDLDGVLSKVEEPSGTGESRGDKPRLRGLGDALECFRAKYFDNDPLDNPLFFEKRVEQPRIPEEFDRTKLRIRTFDEPIEHEYRAATRLSKKPESTGSDLGRSEREKHQLIHFDDQRNRIGKGDFVNQRRNIGGKQRKGRLRGRKHDRTMTTTPEVAITPYQREVYEDVMNTIKNLPGLNRTLDEPALHRHNVHSKYKNVPSNSQDKNVNAQIERIPGGLRSFTTGESLPHKPTELLKSHRYRIFPYRTNRVSYNTRIRNESPLGNDRIRVGHLRTITVHKRSVKDDEQPFDSNIKKIRSKNNATNNLMKPDKSRHVEIDEKPVASDRIVYTIRDRIRHSKPREFVGKHGRFTNFEASESEDIKRHEPRYSTASRKKFPLSEAIATPPSKELAEDAKEETSPSVSLPVRGTASGGYDHDGEPNEYKIQYSTTHGKQKVPNDLQRQLVNESTQDYEETERSSVYSREKQMQNNYDVHEDAQDDVTTLSSIMESTERPKFLRLRKYLQSNPPGYLMAFDEGSVESSSTYSEDEEPEKSFVERRKERSDDEQVEKPSNEESSSKSTEDDDSSGEAQLYEKTEVKEGEESEDVEEEMHSPQVDDEPFHVEDAEKEFERFVSRPFSPFESYEDSKYADLGPRLNKPFFYHPSFSDANNRRKKYSRGLDIDESNEREDEKSSYVFPWNADESDEDEHKDSREKNGKMKRFEYPWERREKFARDREKGVKERGARERLYAGFSEDEEDDEDEGSSNSQLSESFIYPWERYRVPSRNSYRVKADRRYIDNEEMSSDYRPRFSSRYKTRNFNITNNDDPTASISAGPSGEKKPDSKSVKKASNTTTTMPPFASASQKAQKKNPRLETTSVTPSPIVSSRSNKRIRVWRIATTTKNPLTADKGTLESESQKDEVVAKPVRRNRLNSLLMNSSVNLAVGKTFRRRGSLVDQTTRPISTSTEKSPRRRFYKTTIKAEEKDLGHEESTVKSVDVKNTTPEMKTVEHHSRFSKEEIITKTSYPAFGSNDDSYDNNEKMEKNTDSAGLREKFFNESVKKFSITTKETPKHIYRREEIDKNGEKGMFILITPNNGTKSSINADESRKALEDFDDSEKNSDEDPEASFVNDRHILAQLLMRAPPYTYHSMPNNTIGRDNNPGTEGRRSIKNEMDQDKHVTGIAFRYVKNPNERLYYYLEDL